MNENTMPMEALTLPGEPAPAPVRTLEVIGAEIRTFTASMVNNIIEIGRRMCEAKEMLPYGQFGDWIKANTGYSRSTANNFMRIFQEYGARQGSLFGATLENEQAFGKLTYTKALALLDVPAEEREQFVQDHDVENMSTRELQTAIAERDAAIKRAEDAEDRAKVLADGNAEMETKTLNAMHERDELKLQIAELEARPAKVVADQEAIDKAVAEAVKKADDAHAAEIAKIKADAETKRKSLEKKASDAEAKAAKAAEKLKKAESDARVLSDAEGAEAEAKAATEDAVKAKAEAEKARAEADELRRQLAMSGEATVTFKVYFASWQNAYSKMMDALARADDETAGRLKAAIKAQIEGWTNE